MPDETQDVQGALFGAIEGDKTEPDIEDFLTEAGISEDDDVPFVVDNERDFDDDVVLGPATELHRHPMVPREPFPVLGAVLIARGTVIGKAKTAGSKVAGSAGKWVTEGGKKRFIPSLNERGVPKTFVGDSSGEPGKAWRSDIRDAVVPIVRAMGIAEPLDMPLALEVVFFRPRAKSHHGTGANAAVLKDSAPMYPEKVPDAVKLMRAFEDALNEFVWTDDSRNVDVLSRKRYTNGPARAQWRLWKLPATVGDARLLAAHRS